jgi:hypothetical protein
MKPETYLAVQQSAVPDRGKIFRKNALARVESNLSIRSASSVHPLQELSNRLLIIDELLHFARSEMKLVGELWQLILDKIFRRGVLFMRRSVRGANGEDVRDQLRMPVHRQSNTLLRHLDDQIILPLCSPPHNEASPR